MFRLDDERERVRRIRERLTINAQNVGGSEVNWSELTWCLDVGREIARIIWLVVWLRVLASTAWSIAIPAPRLR